MYEVRVTPINEEGSKLVGMATLLVDGKFAFGGIKLLATDNPSANHGRGYNVVMPSYKDSYGEYNDFFMPVNKQMHNELGLAIHKSLTSGKTQTFGKEEIPYAVKVKEYKNSSNGIRGTATLAFDKEFVCSTLQIRENKNGDLFVAYPSYKTNKVDENGKPEFKNVCNPITKEFKDELQEKILGKMTPEKNKSISGNIESKDETVEQSFKTPGQERKYSSR